jgi:short-subunit dehydrogenase
MRRALIVGGANGIGLSIATHIAQRDDYDRVYILDKSAIESRYHNEKFVHHTFDLLSEDYSILNKFDDIDTLMITAGFGRLAHFADVDEQYIIDSFGVNTTAVIRIIHHFYYKLQSSKDFYCGVMGSISGFISSPLFAVYGASKAALKIFIESVNVELEMTGSKNRILNISPGSIRGTSFYNGATDLSLTSAIASDIIEHLYAKDDLFIPQYEEIFKDVLARYHNDFRAEGRHSYEYKMQSDRMKK